MLPNNLTLRILGKNLKIACEHSLVPSIPCRNECLDLVLKKYEKTDIKVFPF